MYRVSNMLACCLITLLPSIVVAQTPDGQPPRRENICDSVTGASFGLCNAFCEAMDCDSPTPQASATACEKVRSNWEKQQGVGTRFPCDPQPPQGCSPFDDTWTAVVVSGLPYEQQIQCVCDRTGDALFANSWVEPSFPSLCFSQGGDSAYWSGSGGVCGCQDLF